jgi:hypothetical protein
LPDMIFMERDSPETGVMRRALAMRHGIATRGRAIVVRQDRAGRACRLSGGANGVARGGMWVVRRMAAIAVFT